LKAPFSLLEMLLSGTQTVPGNTEATLEKSKRLLHAIPAKMINFQSYEEGTLFGDTLKRLSIPSPLSQVLLP